MYQFVFSFDDICCDLLVCPLIHDHFLTSLRLCDELVIEWEHNLVRILVLFLSKSSKTTSSCQVFLGEDACLDQERIAVFLSEVEELAAVELVEVKSVFFHN
jgi:hypothetical protein